MDSWKQESAHTFHFGDVGLEAIHILMKLGGEVLNNLISAWTKTPLLKGFEQAPAMSFTNEACDCRHK